MCYVLASLLSSAPGDTQATSLMDIYQISHNFLWIHTEGCKVNTWGEEVPLCNNQSEFIIGKFLMKNRVSLSDKKKWVLVSQLAEWNEMKGGSLEGKHRRYQMNLSYMEQYLSLSGFKLVISLQLDKHLSEKDFPPLSCHIKAREKGALSFSSSHRGSHVRLRLRGISAPR